MDILLIARIIVAVILVILIIPQGSGGGLGSAFGGAASYHTRRGMEKGIFNLTIIFAVIFAALSIATLI